MARFRFGSVLCVWILVYLCLTSKISNSSSSMGNENEQERKKQSLWEWQRLRDAYSIYSALFTSSVGQYWGLFKTLVNQAYTHFFPPDIDFRRSAAGDEGKGVREENGAGEKVKEAIAKSLGTSKATVEDAAKSAADIAGETVNKAKETVKNTFSGGAHNKQQQNEL